MRLVSIAVLVLVASAATASPAVAEGELPEGVEQLFTCSHVYSMRSDEARDAGDEGGSLEFFHMGDALLVQAQNTLLAAGYTAQEIDDIDMNSALVTGFNYGAGMGEEMLADCLAAWDSP